MTDFLLRKVITIKGIETKEGETQYGKWQSFIVTDQENNRYSFFATKKDGNPTKAAQQMKEQGLTIGSKVLINYKEEEKSFQKEGKTMNYKARNIAFFSEVPDVPNL